MIFKSVPYLITFFSLKENLILVSSISDYKFFGLKKNKILVSFISDYIFYG